MERRKFLRNAASTMAVPFLFQGQWLKAMAGPSVFELLNAYNSNRKLIMVQLNGGNDGLNLLIPTSEYDNLAVQRANILLPKAQILKLTDETGLHPSMPEIVSLYKDGKIQIIQGVGYPNPNLSHFRSKDILMSASDSNVNINSGWMGRLFTNHYPGYPIGYPNSTNPHPIALTIGSTSSAICQAESSNYSSVISSLSTTYSSTPAETTYPATPFGNELKFITNIMEQTGSYLSVIKEAASKAKNLSALYPAAGQNSLADQLKLVANLIGGGLQTQIYVVSLGGWDTHSAQVASTDKSTGSQPALMSKLSKAIAAFQDDLRLLKKEDEVIGLVFTEFGRRIMSNDSLGTDHGTTWPAIVFGSKVNPAIIGSNPKISSVVDKTSNLPLQNDFRSIYAAVFKQWFEIPQTETNQLLGKAFTEIPLIAGTTIGLVAENKPIANVKFWPNPVADTASLSFEANGQFTQIGIYSMSGQLIEHLYEEKFIEGKQLLLLHLGHLRRGVYLIVLIQNQQRQSLKFVKI
ncbi:MAG: DUF1501 domain-containing protein [Prolixibacteraceae bacterium]